MFALVLVLGALAQACTSNEKPAQGVAAPPTRAAIDSPPRPLQPAAEEAKPALVEPVAAPTSPGSSADAAGVFPPRWSEQLGLASIADVSKQFAAPTGVYGELSLGDKTELPKSCADWARLHAAGYEPSTAVEVQSDNGAKSRCLALGLLQRAKPANRSFVRELKLTPKIVSLLPAALAANLSPKDQARVEATNAAQLSLKQHDPKLKAKKGILPDSLEVNAGDGQSYLLIEPLAWADFNGDGVDDIVLSVSQGASQGSALAARVVTLSRDDESSVLRIIEAR